MKIQPGQIIKIILISISTILVTLFALLWLCQLILDQFLLPATPSYGVTFSDVYSRNLKQDPLLVYQSLVMELKIKQFRIPIYWSEVEKKAGYFDFSFYDRLLTFSEDQGVRLILAIGYKLPRWPECFAPGWAINLDYRKRQEQTLTYLQKTIEHFKENPAVYAWQIENEPLFQFGLCGKTDSDFLNQEVLLVRKLDNKPIILTDSGELGNWVIPMELANQMGSSLYKKTWNSTFGFFQYPLPPVFYPAKAWLVSTLFKTKSTVFISELQAEPWTPGIPIELTPIDEQLEIFSLDQFKANIAYAKKTGLPVNWLWGAEWWYFMKEKGHPEYWEYAQGLF